MAIGFKHGSSGGDPLNFTVVNSTTEPVSPKENTIWVNTSNILNCWTYGLDTPVRRSKNKNFVTYPPCESVVNSKVTSVVEKNGLTFTLDTDMSSNNTNAGKITVNGTATKDTYYRQSHLTIEDGLFFLPKGTYFMSGCPSGGSKDTYMLGFSVVDLDNPTTGINIKYDYGSGARITITEDSFCRISIYIRSGTTLDNATFYFQIEAGTSATAYERGNCNGQVWIKPGINSNVCFEALKKNSKGNNIMLYPTESYVFRNNYTWSDFTNKTNIYQNGTWIPIETTTSGDDSGGNGSSGDTVYYYRPGDTCNTITGGWTNDGWSHSGYSVTKISSVNNDYMHVVSTADYLDAIGTTNKINLSGINTINIGINVNYVGAKTVVGIYTSKNITSSIASKNVTATGQQTVSLDVSSYNDSYYIVIYTVGTSAGGGESYVTSVWGGDSSESSGGNSGGDSGGSTEGESGGNSSGGGDSGGDDSGGNGSSSGGSTGDDSGGDSGGSSGGDDSGGSSGGTVYYDVGNEYKSVTGGWTATGWTAGTSYNILSSETFAKLNSNHIYLLTNANFTMTAMGTTNKVNLSGVNTLKANINTTLGSRVELWIGTDKNYLNKIAYDQNTTRGEHTLSVDVSSYNSSYYIVVCVIGTDSSNNIVETKVTKIWSE